MDSKVDMASPNEREENSVSQTVPVVEASTSRGETTAVSAKHSRKVVYRYQTTFHTSPWLRMGASPRPPCTNSATSCEDYHGDGKTEATELSDHFNDMTIEMIKHCSDLRYFQCHISPTQYPGVKVIQSVVHLILNTHNFNALTSAQLLLRMLLELHPPCAYKMGAYYKQILLDSWTDNGKEIKQGIFYDIVSKLEEEMNRTGTVYFSGPSVSAMSDPEGTFQWSFMDSKAERCYKDLSISDRIKRLFIVFDFIVDVLEHDLVVWLVKHCSSPQTRCMVVKEETSPDEPLVPTTEETSPGESIMLHNEEMYPYKPSVLIMKETRPLIVTAIWTNTYSPIGSVSGICKRLIELYLKGFSSHQAHVSFKTFHKMFAVIIETMHAAEQRFDTKEITEYGLDCENMANKFLEYIARADLSESDLLYMFKSLKPPWLPFYMCDSQILNKFFTNDSASLAIMRKSVEHTYKTLQQERKFEVLYNDN